VDAGIDDQPHGAQLFVLQRAVTVPWILVEPHLVAKRLGIKPPALDEGGGPAKTHEGRQRLVLLRQTDLEMVPRRAFVQIERDIARGQPAGQVIGVEIESARARAVGRTLLV